MTSRPDGGLTFAATATSRDATLERSRSAEGAKVRPSARVRSCRKAAYTRLHDDRATIVLRRAVASRPFQKAKVLITSQVRRSEGVLARALLTRS